MLNFLIDKKLMLGNGYCLPAGPLTACENGLTLCYNLTGESYKNKNNLFKIQ